MTIARGFTDSFAGIAPAHVPMFIAAQLIGAVIALGVTRILAPAAAQQTAHLKAAE